MNLKESCSDRPSAWAVACSKRELSIASAIRSPHVARYLGVEHDDGRVAVVVEPFGDTSLAEHLAHSALSLKDALGIGIQLAAGLADIHAKNVIHRAIHPGNVLLDSSSMRAKIVDFSSASLLESKPDPSHGDALSIPLAYVSPEQTGRTNQRLDYRTDFYSLGATLFHALAGQPPFPLSDQLSLVHAHIASAPPRLHQLNPRTPEAVSAIVNKLLAKNAADRYQSAQGIVADLERCVQELQSTGSIRPFELARHDVSDKFVISQSLYGRSAERAELLDAFDAAAKGDKLFLLVTGPSGIGKSALVSDIYKPTLERRGTFVTSKFDPLHRHAPYSALAQALRQLCRGLFRLPEAELAARSAELVSLLSVNAGLIVELAPELEQVIGPKPPVPATGLLEAQHRFDLTLARFLSAFANRDHPLVLFFDDMQHADPATLHALGAVMRLSEPTHLLVIGACRDNEVNEDHPLRRTLQELRDAGVDTRTLELTGLCKEDVLTLLSETLHQPRDAVRELARVVVEKTAGNPFFVHQFVRALYEENYVRFDRAKSAWTWDVKAFEERGITDNVVDLMLRKLERLPASTREALQLAACIGTTFDLALLAATAGVTRACMGARLAPAIRAGVVVPLDPEYPLELVEVSNDQGEEEEPNYRHRFLHDRVQQAAYESLAPAERRALHLALGRMLAASDVAQRMFEATNQLNRGAHLITDPDERERLARMNLLAGKRALSTTAYNEALSYLEHGLRLLPKRGEGRQGELGQALRLAYVEGAYRAGRFEDAKRTADALLRSLHTPEERAQLYRLRIGIETQRGNHQRAIDLARVVLEELGHPLPNTLSLATLLKAKVKVALAMRGRSPESLERLPEATDRRIIEVADIMGRIQTPAYMANPKLFFWLSHEILLLALKHGLATSMIPAFLNYGLCLIAQNKDFHRASSFGRISLALTKRSDAFPYRGITYCAFASCLEPFAGGLRTALPIARRSIDMAVESGDLVIASFAATVVPDLMVFCGAQLTETLREVQRGERLIRSFRGTDMMHAARVIRQAVRCLRGETTPLGSFSTANVSEDDLATEMDGARTRALRVFYPLRRVMAHVIFGQYEQASTLVLRYDEPIERGVAATYAFMEYTFYAALALIGALRSSGKGSRSLERSLNRKMRHMARWAESAPTSYRPKYLLVCAERADLEGDPQRAMQLYEAGLRESEGRDKTNVSALTLELAGRAALRHKNHRLMRAYMADARAAYERWGALGKVQALDEEFPTLSPKADPHGAALSIDVMSLVRTSQALSQETSLPAVLERVMRVLVQTSGAQRGSLLRVPDAEGTGELQIEAHLDGERNAVLVPGEAERLKHGLVSEAIVRHTLRTGEDIVLANAYEVGAFTNDPYVMTHRSRSILSLPVRQRDRVVGVLFLDNTLSIGAFTEERLEVLRVILTQAAISLENARLIDSLRRQQSLLRDFLEGMPLGVYVTDAQGRPAFANRMAIEIGGGNLEPPSSIEAVTQAFAVYQAGTDHLYPLDRSPLARALKGESSMVDDVELRRGGRRIPLGVWGTPIRGEDGSVRHAIVAFQDLSAQHKMRAEHERLEAQLRQAARLEALGRLAGGVAHDFNNLLTPMLVYSELAAHALPADSPIRRQIEQVHEAAERGSGLTRQLLAFGRKQAIEPHVLDLNEELRSFLRMFRRLVREDIEVELHPGSELWKVRADSASLQRILMNLGMNAAEAMPHGGRVTFETANLPAQARGSCDSVALRVIDNGQGIEKEVLAKIFDPFFTTKSPGKGTGLGLATVYGLVEQQGGHLSVWSEPGKGSRFEIVLPRLDEASSAGPARAEQEESSFPKRGHGEAILVVEDDDAVRAVMRDILTDAGYRIVSTDDPRQALTLARGLGEELALLVTDVVMPHMNGRELAELLSRERPGLPVLFVSGYSEDVLAPSDLDDAHVALLPKPLTSEALQAKVHAMVSRQAAPKRA